MHKKIGIVFMLILLLTGCSDIRKQVEAYEGTDDYSLSNYCEENHEVNQILDQIKEIDSRLVIDNVRGYQNEVEQKIKRWEYTEIQIRELNDDKSKQILQLLDTTLAPGIVSFANEMAREENKKIVSGKVFGDIIAGYEIDSEKVYFEEASKTIDTLHIYFPKQKIVDKNYQEIIKSIAEEKLVIRNISFGDEGALIELTTPETLVNYYIYKNPLDQYELPIKTGYQVLIKDNKIYKVTGILSGYNGTKIQEYSIAPLINVAKLMGLEEKELLLEPLPESIQPIKNKTYMLNQTLSYKTSYDSSKLIGNKRAIIMELKER